SPSASNIIAALPIASTIGAIRLRSIASAFAGNVGDGSLETSGDSAKRIMAVTAKASATATAKRDNVFQSPLSPAFGAKNQKSHRMETGPPIAATPPAIRLRLSLLSKRVSPSPRGVNHVGDPITLATVLRSAATHLPPAYKIRLNYVIDEGVFRFEIGSRQA